MSRSRRIRLDRPGPCGGMACPRRAGVSCPCGRPAGPMLGRSAGNRPWIPYRDAGRSSSRILRRRRGSLVPCRFRCRPFRPAAVRRCGMPRRTRCAWNSRGRCMGARTIPILHMGNCAAVIYLGVPRSGVAAEVPAGGFAAGAGREGLPGLWGVPAFLPSFAVTTLGRTVVLALRGGAFSWPLAPVLCWAAATGGCEVGWPGAPG